MQAFKEKVTSDTFWMRTLFVVLFFLVYRLLDIVLLIVTVVQWLFVLLTGQPHASLVAFGGSLGIYLQQITHYLSAVSDEKPFPFSDWPTLNSSSED